VRDNREVVVETGNYLESAAEVRLIVVGALEGRPVYLSDVAEVVDGPDQPARYAWTGDAKGESPAVTIQVTKKPGENAVEVAEQLLGRVGELRGTVIPADVHVAVTRNYGATANDKAKQLIRKLLFATLSVVVLVFLTLGMRAALIVGTAVLLTLATTLFASWAWGFTLNRVSLFALIFSIGILVDDAIVVVENVHRRLALDARPLAEVIPPAVDEVGGPTILATFTVIAALLPMAFVTGLMGPYMSPIPINASMGMLISLAIALVVTPWLALHLLGAGAKHRQAGGRLERAFARLLGPFVTSARAARNRKWLALGVLALIALSLSLAGLRLVVLKMLPFDNKSEFQVVLDMPAGTPVEMTAAALHEMGAAVVTVPEVTDYQAYAGLAAPINFNGLVRQYYLRTQPRRVICRSTCCRRMPARARATSIAQTCGRGWSDRAQLDARVKVSKVPPGPPVLAPHRRRGLRPDAAAASASRQQVRARCSRRRRHRRHRRLGRDSRRASRCGVDQAKASLSGVARRTWSSTMRARLSAGGRHAAARCVQV
jgi:multidrug efflux pump subunit AcrB